MLNAELLKKTIKDSGFKIGFIADKLGLSYQGFQNKLDEVYPFKLDEIQKICNTLNLDSEIRDRIFFAQNVDKASTKEE